MPYYLSSTPEEDAAFQRRGWTEVAAYLREIDPYHNLVTVHPTRFGREMVENPALLDFEMLQTGHSGLDSVSTTVESVLIARERLPLMPIVTGEVNYEGILGGSWQDVQRLSFYGSVFSGAAGHTYGANGLWQASRRDRPYGPSPHGRCWGNTPWDEAAQFPGSAQIGLGGRFISRFPWWDLERHPEWVEFEGDPKSPWAIRCMGIPNVLRLVYVPRLWDPPRIKGIEPQVRYAAYYFDPCTGTRHDLGSLSPDPRGAWQPPFPPEVHDWLLIVEASRC